MHARSKRLDNRKRRCSEQPRAIKGKALKLLGKRIQDQNLTFRAKVIDRRHPETLTLSEIKFEDRKLAFQQNCKEDEGI